MNKKDIKVKISDKSILPNINQARKRLKKAEVKREDFVIDKDMKNFGKNKTFHIRTYGCQSNVRDGETIKGILLKMGFK